MARQESNFECIKGGGSFYRRKGVGHELKPVGI